MFKLLSLISVIVFSSQAQAIIIGCGHGGTNCKHAGQSSLKTYDCWGSGAEDPDFRLVKKTSDIDDGIVNLIARTEYFRNQLSGFQEMAVPGTVGSVENVDLFSEEPVCTADESRCLQIKKGSLSNDSAAFILSVEESSFGSMSFVCKSAE